MWIRQSDLPKLRSWANASNPMWTKAIQPALQQAINTYNTQYFPGGQENPSWPDPGTDQSVLYATEAYAEMFAFASLIDPDVNARTTHANRARNLLMHAINEAAKGVDTSSSPAPYRSKMFSLFNRANYWGEAWGLTVDWIYPTLTAADKATIRKVFLRWADECVNAYVAGNEHPMPVGVLNDPQLLSDKKRLRWAANNYYSGHMRSLTLMSLSLDAADDPLVDTSAPVNKLGNSLRSYLADVTGAWLYQQYALFEDPAVSSAALGVPASGLGAASGGIPVEGSLYGESIGYFHEALLALYTAGYADPSLSGPQAGMITSGYWDRWTNAFLHTLAPAAKTSTDPNYAYMGPLYDVAAYGDMIRFWMTPEFIMPVGSLGVLDGMAGNTKRVQTMRWLAENALQGGSGKLYERAGNIWGNSYATGAILYFMLFDPAAASAADPRPSLPTTFVDKNFGRVLSRTDWSANASWFTYLCGWETINHQNGTCNQFELYRKGEWLTKELSGYSDDLVLMATDYNNTLSIQNDVPTNLSWWETEISKRGGQWINGMNAGDPTMVTSQGSGWLYVAADGTNLYNRPGQSPAVDVTDASRSTVWLSPDYVVVYDRATTNKSNRFKRFNLTLTGATTVNGKKADSVTPGGQHLFIQNLLPQNAALTVSAVEDIHRIAEKEPGRYRLVAQDPSNPADVRFLHVLQGADANGAQSPATLVQSTSGTAFQGAVVKNMAVMFPVSKSAAFSGTTYTIPSGVTTHLVTGLTPGAAYTATTQSTSSGVQVSISAGGSTKADSAGVLVVAGSPSNPGTDPGTPSTPDVDAGAPSTDAGTPSTDAGTPSTDAGTPSTPGTDAGTPTTCTYTFTPASATIPKAGATQTFQITTQAGCQWLASANQSWIWLYQPVVGTGSGSMKFQVPANATGKVRTGQITVGGKAFPITQKN
ncbi:Serine/threonine kinase associate protein KapC [Minicystis rosea]|nr:Serine/threonine kinase associate protein KapC [Minicystis rosea]